MDIFDFLVLIIKVIDSYLVPLIFAVAFLVFLYGVFKYFIAGAGEEEKRKEGRKYALYGIIGFVIIIAIWGIVNLLISSLGFDTKSRPPIPTFGGSNAAPSNTTNPLPTTNTNNTNNPNTTNTQPTLRANGVSCTESNQCISNYCYIADGGSGVCQPLTTDI